MQSDNFVPIPVIVKIIAVSFFASSIFLIVTGLLQISHAPMSLLSFFGPFGIATGLTYGLCTISWGVLTFIAGRGLWTGKQWGRALALTMFVLHVTFGMVVWLKFGNANYITYTSIITNFAMLAYLFTSSAVRNSFQSDAPTATVALPLVAAIFYILISSIVL